MRKIIYHILFLLMTTSFCYSQIKASYLVKIPNAKYVPKVTHNNKGLRISSSKMGIKSLDQLVNAYEIYSVERAFKSSKSPELKNFYLIECNDSELIFELNNQFKEYYPEFSNNNGETLILPNDFGTTGGYTGTDQEELNYIRAQEAWDITTGSNDIIIGISDNSVQTLHEDLTNKVIHVYGNNYPNNYSGDSQHGSWVASFAAADTNNTLGTSAIGISAIGYDSSIYSATNSWTVGVDTLSRMPGVKVINTAWVNSSSVLQNIINEAVEERGVVIVGSAGNGAYKHGSAESYIYPAAFKNVISVSGIGHQNETYAGHEIFIDQHEFYWSTWGEELYSFQHNDSVDIVAPAVGLSRVHPANGLDGYLDNDRGTSFASPIVSGTIALMFSVNY
ncbi:MAG TPA: S8/S53 family peptidase, partial [Ignavibacteriaceae bacterium]